MKHKDSGKDWRQFASKAYFIWGIYALLGIAMYIAMINTAIPKKLNVHLHEIAKHDIQSPIETIDKEATKVKQQEAVESAPSTYVYKKDAALMQVEKAGDIFDVINEVKTDSDKHSSMDDKIKKVRDKLSDSTNDELSDKTVETLLKASDSELSVAQDMVNTAIYETMNNKIKWSDLERVQKNASNMIPSSVTSKAMRQAMINILKDSIVPNYMFDANATKRNKEEAARQVDNVVIHQGEVIVKKGELITRDVMHKLKVVGLLDNHLKVLPFIGLAIFVLFLTSLLIMECQHFKTKQGAPDVTRLLTFLVIFIFILLLIKLDSILENTHTVGINYLVPIATGAWLIRMLLSKRLAIVSSAVFSLCGSLIFGESSSASVFDMQMGVYLLLSSLAGVFALKGHGTRFKLLQTGFIISVINVFIVAGLIFIQNGTLHLYETGLTLGFAFLSGLLSTILTFGLMPFFEATFGILSPIKLIELSNPNHPLLRKILMEAPGTYHHSVMVANLAERACDVIGANGLLARVAAYYHDIGKTKRPRFFVENQFNHENPHEKISPQLSRTIIISHPYDGADILRKHHMPKEIIDIAEQHHGTTLLKYFYHKAKEVSDQEVLESEFRYPGPKAQTKEAAVVELADSIEAAVRSMAKPTPMKIESLVQKIFNERLEDGQFDECDITLNELRMVKESICETLNGVFHSRIEYPEESDHKKVNNK
ncbi:putative nucleotidyltransferase with HDIG domain [Scopulibacillus daqui]|uniref:Nucleotidyltransferase with HDIG domain n=1 Tax=Scopulibacillus daqui TaxID=1469162 RepID=A0ABS2Q0H9_9BACL|nr:HD family phosphohydrolase [Scopulibacillus daqui]MBM7645798.1 putative nucleotidyltransferase with HDIG domain [Scopulibacillus daqui]